MNQCLGITFMLALIWNNHPSLSGDCMEKCSSENGVLFGYECHEQDEVGISPGLSCIRDVPDEEWCSLSDSK